MKAEFKDDLKRAENARNYASPDYVVQARQRVNPVMVLLQRHAVGFDFLPSSTSPAMEIEVLTEADL